MVEFIFDQQNSINVTRTISGNLSNSIAIFVTTNGDIYIDNGASNGRVDKWTSCTNTWTSVIYFNAPCFSLFVDINNTTYCSMRDHHQVVRKWLTDNANTSSIAAGTSTLGFTSNTFHNPHGIFLDANFDLYVADSGNYLIPLSHSIIQLELFWMLTNISSLWIVMIIVLFDQNLTIFNV
jgi:hypothetical protein